MKNGIEIKSKSKNYRVSIINEADELINEINIFKEVVIIIDEYIFKKYNYLFEKINQYFVIIPIKSTEESKNLSTIESLLEAFQSHNVSKATTIIAIGGGIIQDISCFTSHIYYRGLDLYYFPTTLLAMCDSCIGSKCGLNFNGFKNQLGVFHPPNKVIIWLGFLDSLSQEAVHSGYGEILKLRLISGKIDFKELRFISSNLDEHRHLLYQYIYESLNIKKKFIEVDEFDLSTRRLLNYGHTFGHALELATEYAIPHGIAVARGIDIVNYISLKKGFMVDRIYADIHGVIKENFIYNNPLAINADDLIKNTRRDKKNSNGMLNLVLLKKPGDLFIHPVQFNNVLNDIVCDYLELNSY